MNPFKVSRIHLEHRDAFSTLLNETFHVPTGESYLEDFPVWDPSHELDSVRCFGVFHSETHQLVSSAGVRLAHFDQDHPIALIGAVSTSSQFRSLGLASQVVLHAIEWAKQQGALIVFLWSAEVDFYRKLGFEPCGIQYRIPLKQVLLKEQESDFRIEKGWSDAIFSQIQQRKEGLSLHEKDLKWYREHKNVQWWRAMNQNQLIACAGLGRGIDLKDHVHEWGGDPQGVLLLFREILRERPEAILMMGRSHLETFTILGSIHHEEYLCMAKWLGPSRFWRSIPVESSLAQLFGGPGMKMQRSLWFWGLDSS